MNNDNTVHEKMLELEKICRERGLRLTVQRRIILEALLGRVDHPTAEEIYEEVRSRIPGLSRTTVYRVLEILVATGVARPVPHIGSAARFEPNLRPHHHLICTTCKRVMDFDSDELDRLRIPELVGGDFRVTEHAVQIYGVCADCRAGRGGPPTPRSKT